MARSKSAWVLMVAGLIAASGAWGARSTADEVAVREPVEAIWMTRSVDFVYSNLNSYYSCTALQSKLRAILQAAGAQHQLAVRMQCASGDLVDTVRAQITMIAPVEATAGNVAAATTFDGRYELIARLRNVQLPTATDIERFAASWRTVTIARGPELSLDAGDCELLKDVSEQIFPRLSVRVDSKLSCAAPGTRAAGRLRLVITALLPLEPAQLTASLK